MLLNPDAPGLRPAVRGARRGAALVAALALLALAAALLAGAFASSVAVARGARSALAALRAESAARRAIAERVAELGVAADSLAIGSSVEQSDQRSGGGPPITTRTQRLRLTPRLYALTVDVRVGDGVPPLARRRYRLFVERIARADTGSGLGAPVRIAQWSVVDLY